MSKHLDNAEGFCAEAKTIFYNSEYWRGKNKTDKEVQKDIKKHPLK